MLQYQLKLRLTPTQEKTLEGWLWNLTGLWNFGVRKILLDAKDGIYHSSFDFVNLIADHSKRLEISAHTLQGTLGDVHTSWSRCFKGISRRPRLKGMRRPLRSIPFPDPIKTPVGNKIALPVIGKLRFHKQVLPAGKIKSGRIIRKASGWYLCLFIDATRAPIKRLGTGAVGIDPGFSTLLTLSNGVKIPHPRELEAAEKRLAQAQRGGNKQLVARMYEHVANQKKDRNHKLSLWLVENFTQIYFSKDNIKGIAKRFGKSVGSSNHFQLRQMLKYKSPIGGTEYNEVDSPNSTRTCNVCWSREGPTGLAGLSVRSWVCSACGSRHDRDINSAIFTLKTGVGLTHESRAA